MARIGSRGKDRNSGAFCRRDSANARVGSRSSAIESPTACPRALAFVKGQCYTPEAVYREALSKLAAPAGVSLN